MDEKHQHVEQQQQHRPVDEKQVPVDETQVPVDKKHVPMDQQLQPVDKQKQQQDPLEIYQKPVDYQQQDQDEQQKNQDQQVQRAPVNQVRETPVDEQQQQDTVESKEGEENAEAGPSNVWSIQKEGQEKLIEENEGNVIDHFLTSDESDSESDTRYFDIPAKKTIYVKTKRNDVNDVNFMIYKFFQEMKRVPEEKEDSLNEEDRNKNRTRLYTSIFFPL